MSNEDLVRRWVTGWSLSRGWSPEAVGEGILAVKVGEPGRSVEFLVLDADGDPDRVERAAALALAAPGTAWVTVPTDQREARLAELRIAGLEIKAEAEWLMTVDLTGRPVTAVHGQYLVESEQGSDVVVARVMINGVVAASGRMAVVGTDAVADRIETDPAYRRRGMGQTRPRGHLCQDRLRHPGSAHAGRAGTCGTVTEHSGLGGPSGAEPCSVQAASRADFSTQERPELSKAA